MIVLGDYIQKNWLEYQVNILKPKIFVVVHIYPVRETLR